jgi:hypothetical protein
MVVGCVKVEEALLMSASSKGAGWDTDLGFDEREMRIAPIFERFDECLPRGVQINNSQGEHGGESKCWEIDTIVLDLDAK